MFRTKTSRSLVLFGAAAVIGVSSLWSVTGNLQSSVLFYVVSSVVIGGVLAGLKVVSNWIQKGEE